MAKKKGKKRGRARYKSGPKKGKFMSNRAIAARKGARGKKKTTKKRKPTALVKRGKTSMAKKKKKSRRRGRRGGGGRGIPTGEIKELMIGGAIYGFITEPDVEDEGAIRATIVSTLAKMPNIGNRDISNGVALYLIDKHLYPNQYIRMVAKAALLSGAVRFGRRGMKLGGAGDEGWHDAVECTKEGEQLSGVME